MLSTGVIGLFGIFAFIILQQTERHVMPLSSKVASRLQKLWEVAQSGMKEKKYLRAEKALLTILKLDQKNAAAYNRLGILYSRQKEYKDAIECFEIASSIEPSASSLHNLGLIYYETENYEKAATAFEGALKLEEDLATRHIAYAKVQEKLGNERQMIISLERAAELEPNQQTYRHLLEAYDHVGDKEAAQQLRQRIKRQITTSTKKKSIRRPRRVIY